MLPKIVQKTNHQWIEPMDYIHLINPIQYYILKWKFLQKSSMQYWRENNVSPKLVSGWHPIKQQTIWDLESPPCFGTTPQKAMKG